MSTLLFRNAILADGSRQDILIDGKFIRAVAPRLEASADECIECGGRKAVLPGFCNLHTHAAMTLLRSYADDLELFRWLNDFVWPVEAKMTGEDIYWGTRLACLEMARSGITCFNDMYWHQPDAVRAIEDSGLRASVGLMFLCGPDGQEFAHNVETNEKLWEAKKDFSDRISVNLAPHAIYTVAAPVLRRIAERSAAEDLPIHIHAAETQTEFDDCRKAHDGMTPIAYLDSLGIITERTILAHCVHLTDADIEIIARRGAVIVHNPCSNWKLVSGLFSWHRACDLAKCRVALGTDGACSNNNLSMFDTMKFAALAAKIEAHDPTAAPADKVWEAATKTGAAAARVNAGEIAPGKLADLMVADLDQPPFLADCHLISNLVYAADPGVIESVLCNGRWVMRDRVQKDEALIVKEFRRSVKRLMNAR